MNENITRDRTLECDAGGDGSLQEKGSAEGGVDLSVIVVLHEAKDADPVRQLFGDYREQVERTGLRYEFIFVIDGDHPALLEDLRGLQESVGCIKILKLAMWHGDATALSAGCKHARGGVLLTLPDHHQVDPQAIPGIVRAVEEYDMVVVRRWPRVDSWLNRLQTRVFHSLLRTVLDLELNDITCQVRAFRRKVIETVHIYGDQHRFFPILAGRYGFRVKEVEASQSGKDAFKSHVRVGVYVRRLLDLLSIFFLVKFTKKPLRFFGLPGVVAFSAGTLYMLYLAFERLYMGEALVDRPALLLGLLLITLGVQLFAIGIIGELIIFIHARSLKEYAIETIVN